MAELPLVYGIDDLRMRHHRHRITAKTAKSLFAWSTNLPTNRSDKCLTSRKGRTFGFLGNHSKTCAFAQSRSSVPYNSTIIVWPVGRNGAGKAISRPGDGEFEGFEHLAGPIWRQARPTPR